MESKVEVIKNENWSVVTAIGNKPIALFVREELLHTIRCDESIYVCGERLCSSWGRPASGGWRISPFEEITADDVKKVADTDMRKRFVAMMTTHMRFESE
jgi:hypothetical protein